MDPRLFVEDVERVPAVLSALADALEADDPWAWVDPGAVDRVLFLGMGSSRYAAEAVAQALRADGVNAVAEVASADATWPPSPGQLTVAVSATGGSAETLHAADRYAGRLHPRGAASASAAEAGPLVAVVEDTGSELAGMADRVVPLLAGKEAGGVACRTYRHTLVQLLALRARLTGRPLREVVDSTRRAAEATADLLDRRPAWLPRVIDALDGPDGIAVIAKAEHRCSAEQSALMVREGPRRPATASETGDWAHVDVYLAKTLDYRVLLFPGSRWDAQAMEWLTRRKSRVVPVGAEVEGAEPAVRHRHSTDPWASTLTHPLIAELAAAHWWGLTSPG